MNKQLQKQQGQKLTLTTAAFLLFNLGIEKIDTNSIVAIILIVLGLICLGGRYYGIYYLNKPENDA